MLRICLCELGRGRIALSDVHLAQVGPAAGDSAAPEPVAVGQAAVEASGKQIGAGVLNLSTCDEQQREKGVQRLNEDLPEQCRNEDERLRGNAVTQEPQASLDRFGGARDIPPLERQLTQFAVDLRPRHIRRGESPGCLERARCVPVVATQHLHVPESFQDLPVDVGVGAVGATLRDPVVPLGDLERVPGARLISCGKRIRKRATTLTGRISLAPKPGYGSLAAR